MNQEIIKSIREKLAGDLPGQRAHVEMSHILRRTFKPTPDGAQESAVLLLLFPQNGQWQMAFTQRASKYAHDKHKGQMSFPGGKMEPTDNDLVETAKRETFEEIGVQQDSINVLGTLSQIYIPVSNFVVQPVVAYTEKTPDFVLEENEVAELVIDNLERICSNDIRHTKDIAISKQMTLKRVPYFDIRGKVVWGATAMILNEFVTLLKHKNVA